MKPSAFALLLSSVIAGAAFATNALAVDTIISRDAPDLAAVRAKIKARDFKGALAELTPMLSRPIPSIARRSISIPTTRERSNISASSTSKPARSIRRRRTSCG